jgi:hypothetical protein
MRRQLLAAAIVFAPLACLDSIEPTPDSSPLSITPAVGAVPVKKLPNLSTITLSLRVQNRSDRVVYVDLLYRKTDKLIDQKWEVVAESPPSTIFRSIEPGQTQQILYVLSYEPGRYPLLEKVRGVYRIGLRGFYDLNITEPLPSQPAYSTSFVIVEND